MWAPSHWVHCDPVSLWGRGVRPWKASFCVFPAASTCALQCFSLRTKAPLGSYSCVCCSPEALVGLMTGSCFESSLWVRVVLGGEGVLHFRHTDEIVPAMAHRAQRFPEVLGCGWPGKTRWCRYTTEQLTMASVEVTRDLDLRPCVFPSPWNPVSLRTGIQDFCWLSFSALPIVRKWELGT